MIFQGDVALNGLIEWYGDNREVLHDLWPMETSQLSGNLSLSQFLCIQHEQDHAAGLRQV